MKYLKPSSLYLNLCDTTILSVSTQSKSIACLDLRNSFLLTLILLNFNVFSIIIILHTDKLIYLFFNASFLY